MTSQNLAVAARVPAAAKRVFKYVMPEVLVLVLLAALSLAYALLFPEQMAAVGLLF